MFCCKWLQVWESLVQSHYLRIVLKAKGFVRFYQKNCCMCPSELHKITQHYAFGVALRWFNLIKNQWGSFLLGVSSSNLLQFWFGIVIVFHCCFIIHLRTDVDTCLFMILLHNTHIWLALLQLQYSVFCSTISCWSSCGISTSDACSTTTISTNSSQSSTIRYYNII